MSTSALVIGSNGFVGRRLVAALLEQGVSVQGVSRSVSDAPKISTSRTDQLSSLSQSQEFEAVYLLAAVIPYGAFDRMTDDVITSNVSLPLQVVEHFASSRLVFASSVAVYGSPLFSPIDETHPFNRPNAYGLSKALAEQIVASHQNSLTLRFSSIYGPGMKAPTFVPRLIERGRAEGRLVVYGDGSRMQDYLHVDDAVRMLLAGGDSLQTGVFNAVQGASIANLAVAQIVARRLGDIPVEFAGEDDSPSFVYSREKWDDAFECRPQIALECGLSRTMEEIA